MLGSRLVSGSLRRDVAEARFTPEGCGLKGSVGHGAGCRCPFHIRGTPADRFWAKVRKTNTCWLWIGATIKGGYGSFGGIKCKVGMAHRFSWTLHNGPIPAGLDVLHRCDTPPCVNPEHLFLGTQTDNSRDMVQKGRHYSWNGHKTHCNKGHLLAGDNLGYDRGFRSCKTCTKARALKRKLVG